MVQSRMATLKLTKPVAPRARGTPSRPPLRGNAGARRPSMTARDPRASTPTPDSDAARPVARPSRDPFDQPRRPDAQGARGSTAAPRRTEATPPTSPEQRLADGRRWLAEREARYQEQLRLRFGDYVLPEFAERAPSEPARRDTAPQRQPSQPRERRAAPNTAFGAGAAANDRHRNEPRDDRDDRDDEPTTHAPGSLRLSKRMSELGIASRREADEWIAKGWVRVDEQVVKELGSRVVPSQRITVDAKARFQQAQRVTVLIHKPIGYVSGQAEDGYEPAYVLVTPDRQWTEDHSGTRFLREHLRNLAPAGRLDIDSTGLLVLTQDGRVAKQLIGEDSELDKEYLVRVEPLPEGTPFDAASLALLNHGLELDGEPLRPAQVEWLNADQLRFVLRQGKKRQVRRMCELVGLKVVGLKRVRIGAVMLGDLPVGQWRYLRRDESFV
ncbi:MAG: pseudouridine synthase [Burkholderiaceae bacterium]